MSETDPLRAALLHLANKWLANVRPGGGIPSEVRDVHVLLSTIPEPLTYTEYGTQLAGFDGRAEVNREVAESALFEGTNRQLVQRQVTAWEPVKDFAPSPGDVKNRAETLHMEEA